MRNHEPTCQNNIFRALSLVALLTVSLTCHAAPSEEQQAVGTYTLPSEQTWLTHLRQGLARYWMQPSAYGDPIGNFPTFRCGDGSSVKLDDLCPELDYPWIKSQLGREFTRMKSRQTFAYGVIYHMTGDPKALALAKAGVNYLSTHLWDQEHGGFISVTEQGDTIYDWQQRTAQDQAYAMLGIAFYYYLTRDPEVEKMLIAGKKHIFDHYKDTANNQMLWVIKDSEDQFRSQQELVAQLDQINAYMLLVTPLLPEPQRKQWRKDLFWLTNSMLANFHSTDEQRFFGAIHHKAAMQPNARHNDYGHTIKGYWMTYLVARYLGHEGWEKLSTDGIKSVLARASMSWEIDDLEDDELRADAIAAFGKDAELLSWRASENEFYVSWWQWAELDQAAMTIGLTDASQLRYVAMTYPGFMRRWIDPEFGEVGPKSAKQFHWKNGYHTLEHALIGYIGSQAQRSQAATLYFALDKNFSNTSNLNPYYFQGEVANMEWLGAVTKGSARQKVKVSFIHVQP